MPPWKVGPWGRGRSSTSEKKAGETLVGTVNG